MDEKIRKLIIAPVFKNYIEMMEPISEAPLEFHLITLLHTISCILGRNVYIEQGTEKIYPNLYTLVVAESSLYKKTSATKQMGKLLMSLDWNNKYLGSIGSPEGLFTELQRCNGTGYLYYSEIGELLSSMKKGFMANAMDVLNDFYDCPTIYRKKLKDHEYKIEKICLSLLAATQKHSLQKDLEEQTLLSGFLPRFFICFSNKLGNEVIWREPVNKHKRDAVIGQLKEIRDYMENIENSIWIPEIDENNEVIKRYEPEEIKLTVTPEAIQYFEKYCRKLRERRKFKSNNILTMYGRIESLILKLSIISHYANMDFSNIISVNDIKKAFLYVSFHIRNYQKLVGEELAFNESSKKIIKAIDMLKKEKQIKTRQLQQNLNLKDAQEVEKFMITLEDDGICEKISKDTHPERFTGNNHATFWEHIEE